MRIKRGYVSGEIRRRDTYLKAQKVTGKLCLQGWTCLPQMIHQSGYALLVNLVSVQIRALVYGVRWCHMGCLVTLDNR